MRSARMSVRTLHSALSSGDPCDLLERSSADVASEMLMWQGVAKSCADVAEVGADVGPCVPACQVERMVASLSSMGAILPAVVLCQALPSPDFDTAFQLLQKAPLMGEREAETYLECIWEVR